MSLSIRARLTFWYAFSLTLIVACLGTFLVLQLRLDLRRDIDDRVRSGSQVIREDLLEDHGQPGEFPPTAEEEAEDLYDAARVALPEASAAVLLDSAGQVIGRFGPLAAEGPLAAAATRAQPGVPPVTTRSLGDPPQHYRVATSRFTRGDERTLVVALSLHPSEQSVQRLLMLLLLSLPVVLVATGSAAYLLARRALLPVQRMTADARAIDSGDLTGRVAVPRIQDELGRLAVTLNAMLDRIERGVVARRRLVADASHGLRTPLAVMRAELDVSLRDRQLPEAAREVLASAKEEVSRLSREVDNLLVLSEADEGPLALLTARVDIRASLEDAARPMRRVAEARGVSLEVDGGHWQSQADAQRLSLALSNLLDNAIKFSPPGGRVRAGTWRSDTEVGVTVSDEGPGIPAGDDALVFDRYARSGDARSAGVHGSGLGLAICREVALAHGGRLWVEPEPGGGSAFSLALPGWRTLGQGRAHPGGPAGPVEPVTDDVAERPADSSRPSARGG